MVEYYYYTGTELAYITDGNNSLKYFFVRDTNGKLLQMIDYKANPVKAYTYIHDVHGSIVGLADNSGNIVVSYGYDAWGVGPTPTSNIVTGSGEPLKDANPLRYSGYQYDWEMGLYYLKARYYSPGLGRFLTVDPLLSINGYIYVDNNPINYIDSNGYSKDRGSQPLNDPWLQGKSEKELQEMYKKETDPVRRQKIKQQQKYLGYRDKKKRQENNKSKKKSQNKSDIRAGQIAKGVGLIIAGGILTVILVADDATGIGVLDDPLIAGTGGMVVKGASMVFGR